MLTGIILATAVIGGGLYLLMRHDNKQTADWQSDFAERMEQEEAIRAGGRPRGEQ